MRLFHWQTHNLSANVRWQHRDDLHMTLHFLGGIDETGVAALLDLAATVPPPPFVVVLDRIGHWPRPRVLWAGPSSVPGELVDLHGRLADGLRARGFEVEARSYRPHVTLARKVPAETPTGPLEPVGWLVGEMALVESTPGPSPVYRPLRRWRIG